MALANADECLQVLAKAKNGWVTTKLSAKVALLKEFCSNLLQHGQSLAEQSGAVKGLPPGQVAGEYMAYVTGLAQYVTRLTKTLQQLDGQGTFPALPTKTLPNGQLAVRVAPLTTWERMSILTAGMTVDLHLQPGTTAATQGAAYTGAGKHGGRVSVVLGAGNHGFLGLKDLMCRLFEYNDVVLFKPHPLHSKTIEPLAALLKPLIDLGVLRILDCDLLTTRHVIYHPSTGHIHITGSNATHDAIVWGTTAEEREERKAANDPLLKVPITSGLSGVSPFIVTPGTWTAKEMKTHALQIVNAAISNVGCNCLACKVVVLPADWEQADEMVEAIKAALRETWMEPAYYPGIQQRYHEWHAHYPDAEQISGPEYPHTALDGVGYLPALLKVFDGVPEDPATEHAFQVEPFAPTLAIVKLHTSGVQEFLTEAVKFSNDTLVGDLCCTLLVDPRAEKEHQALVDKALCDLRFGTVCKNVWSTFAFAGGQVPWRGFSDPAKTLQDPRSGLGAVGNAYLVDNVQKAVVALPFLSPGLQLPAHVRPVPMSVAKGLGGLACGGVVGVIKGLRS